MTKPDYAERAARILEKDIIALTKDIAHYLPNTDNRANALSAMYEVQCFIRRGLEEKQAELELHSQG